MPEPITITSQVVVGLLLVTGAEGADGATLGAAWAVGSGTGPRGVQRRGSSTQQPWPRRLALGLIRVSGAWMAWASSSRSTG